MCFCSAHWRTRLEVVFKGKRKKAKGKSEETNHFQLFGFCEYLIGL